MPAHLRTTCRSLSWLGTFGASPSYSGMIVAVVADVTSAAVTGPALSTMAVAPASHRSRGRADSAAAAFRAATGVTAGLHRVVHDKDLLSFWDLLRSLTYWQQEDEQPQPPLLTGNAASCVVVTLDRLSGLVARTKALTILPSASSQPSGRIDVSIPASATR